MRNKFTGDSLDMSKRIIIRLLGLENLRSLVCPLPSESGFDYKLYRSVLNIGENSFLFDPDGLLFRGPDRTRYISELRNSVSSGSFSSVHVILLDPDKGIHKFKKRNLFITTGEMSDLISENRQKTIAVYHHKNAGRMGYKAVLNEFSRFNAFAYDFGAASICFMQDGVEPINRIKTVLGTALNSKRILEKGI